MKNCYQQQVLGNLMQKYFKLKKFNFPGTSFWYVLHKFSEVATGDFLLKKVFLKVSQVLQENHLFWSLFLLKTWGPTTLLKRDSKTGFSCEIYGNFKNTPILKNTYKRLLFDFKR